VTVDLFGADQSSNAATFYNAGLKGRFEEGNAATITGCGMLITASSRPSTAAWRSAMCPC
jgi:hypothetical protein